MIRKFQNQTPEVHDEAYVAPSAQVIGRVRIAAGASIWDNVVLRGDMDDIVVGENSNIQDCSAVHNTPGIPVVIGSHVTVGHRAVLHSCTIGDNSLIGMGAVVLDGAVIGKDCLVGAGALVTPNTVIPDGSMALGSPAKVVKSTSEAVIAANTRNALAYVGLAKAYKAEE